MEDKRWQVFYSDPSHSRSGFTYSHQAFAFTLSRKKEHCAWKQPPPFPCLPWHSAHTPSFSRSHADLLNVFLPFFALTSAVLVTYPISRSDINTRATVLVGFFFAHLGLRSVTNQYLPRISYSTKLDLYVQLCLLFVLLAAVIAMVSFRNSPVGVNSDPIYALKSDSVTLQSRESAPAPVVGPGGFPLVLLLDDWLWSLWALLWMCTNFYFSQFFLGKYAAAAEARDFKTNKRLQRSSRSSNAELVGRSVDCCDADWCPTWPSPAVAEYPDYPPPCCRLCCTAWSTALHNNFFKRKNMKGCLCRAVFVAWQAAGGLLRSFQVLFYALDAFVCCGSCSRCVTQGCHISRGLSCSQWLSLRCGARAWARCGERAYLSCKGLTATNKCSCCRSMLCVDKPLQCHYEEGP
jgi:hypothetical protein